MFEVGQKLWFVSSQRSRADCEVTVEKAGRVWVVEFARLNDSLSGTGTASA